MATAAPPDQEVAMIVVTPAAPVHVEEAAAVLAGAFETDPVLAAFTRGAPGRRRDRLTHLFRAFVRTSLRHGAVDLARRPDDGAVLGVGVWSAPRPRGSGDARMHLRDIGSLVRGVGITGLRRAARLNHALHAARPAEPHWHLSAIGAHPAGRGLGVGSALLSARLDEVDRAAAPAHLEASTERSAALYARFGFVPTGAVDGFPDGVRPVSMWRPAARPAGLAR